jgi:hypothetical protein
MASSYIQINEYVVLEYEYASNPIPLVGSGSAKTLRIDNLYQNQYQFVNNAQSVNLTSNVLDRNSSLINANSNFWAYHDIDAVFPTISTDPNFSVTDVTSNLIGSVKYDTVKLHILSGYNFEGVEGFISQIIFKEYDGRDFAASNFTYIKGQTFIKFSTTPLFLGDRLYDRYFEFQVPSLYEINEDFWPNPLSPNTFGYQFTHDNTGFTKDSPIFFNFYEIDTITTTNGNRFVTVGRTFDASFPQTDNYTFLGCSVLENPDFDYIEYYPTFNGGFLEEYIAALNSIGGSWVVINQIEVFEQVGTQVLRTANMTMLQDSKFDEPGIFRPVILNAPLAFSYTIEYTMRLVNRNDGQEIIRRATFTSLDPKKYGRQLERINVTNGFRPFKVYNKIVKVSDAAVGASSYATSVVPQPIISRVYINNFIESSYISVDSTSDISQSVGQTVYPQGKNYIFINPFDNFFKFKIFTKSADKKEDVSLDLSLDYNNLSLVFIQDDDTKIYIQTVKDNSIAPASGECLFKVDDSLSVQLYNQKNRDYYLVLKTPEGDDTLIYAGQFARQQDRQKVQTSINNTINDELNKKIAALENAKKDLDSKNQSLQNQSKALSDQRAILEAERNSLANANATISSESAQTSSLNKELQKQIEQIALSNEFLTKEQQALKEALEKATANSTTTNNFNLVEVPGKSTSLGISLKNAVKPLVQNPSKPNANPEFTKPVTGTGGQQIKTVGT